MRSTPLVAAVGVACRFLIGEARADTVSVEECVRKALDHAPAVRVATSETDAARGGVAVGRAAYLPTLSGHGEYGKAKGYDEAVTNGGSTQAVVRIETKLADGVRGADLAAANARLASAAGAERQQRADVAFAVRSAYFSALAARADAALDSAAIRTLQDYVSLLGRQERLSAVPENDVLRARLAVTTEETHRRQVEGDLATAQGELASLVGKPLAAESLVDPAALVETPREPADDVEASAQVVSARTALETAEQEARAIRGEGWGNLALTADAGAIGIRPDDTFSRDGGAQFLVGYTIPLFDGSRSGRLSTALAGVRAARAKLEEARRSVTLTLERLRADEARSRVDAAASRAALPLAEKNFELIRARHLGGGSARLLDVLDAFTQVSELHRAISRAELATRLAAAGRTQALGEVGP